MDERLARILDDLGRALGDLPGVFSTVQWGGRAYKIARRGGDRKRPRLIAFVTTSDDGKSISVGFKLPRDRAAEVIDRHAWIEPHPFATLGRAGWVAARLRRRRDLPVVRTLLAESRALHPMPADDEGKEEAASPAVSGRTTDPVARRIERVMTQERPDGWSPARDEWS